MMIKVFRYKRCIQTFVARAGVSISEQLFRQLCSNQHSLLLESLAVCRCEDEIESENIRQNLILVKTSERIVLIVSPSLVEGVVVADLNSDLKTNRQQWHQSL